MTLSRQNASRYPLSDLQQGMLYHTLSSPRKSTYLVQKIIRFSEPVNLTALEQAWNSALARYPVLRSYFDSHESYYTHQCVEDECTVQITCLDFVPKNYNNNQIEHSLNEFLLEDADKGIKLSKPPLMRLTCLIFNESLTYFVWSYHHALMGGPSTIQVLVDVVIAYEAFKSGNTPDFKETPGGFYIPGTGENSSMVNEDSGRQYWQSIFAGSQASGHLPGTHEKRTSENQILTARQSVYRFKLDTTTTTRLREMASRWNLTPSTFIFGAWGLLLSRYLNNPEVVFGAVRAYPQSLVKNHVGLYINTLPIKVTTEHQTVEAFLREIRQQYQNLAQFITIPLSKLQRWVGTQQNEPLFETFVDFKKHSLNDTLKTRLGNYWLNKYAYQHFDINYAFSLEAQEEEDCLVFDLNYESTLFSSTMIQRYANHYLQTLLFLLGEPLALLDELALVHSEELQELYRMSGHKNPKKIALHTLLDDFDQTTQANPEKKMFLDEHTELTARAAYQQSVMLAQVLHQKNNQPDSKQPVVAIFMERCAEIVVSILAIWRSGGAFLPIDIACPKSRIEYMLNHAGIKIIVTNTLTLRQHPYLRELDYTLVNVDEIFSGNHSLIIANQPVRAQLNDLAYVIYTSGTTGQPKGVMVEHKNLANYVQWFSTAAKLTDTDVSILMLPYFFDASYTNLFPALSLGNQLYIPSQNTLQDVYSTLSLIEKNKITYIKITPSFFRVIVRSSFCDAHHFSLTHLRLIILGGEPIDVEDVAQFRNHYPFVEFMNHYGPTEATIGCCATLINFDQYSYFKSVPVVGKPITGAFAVVVDPQMHLQPIEVVGELLIGGQGISRGYLANPELSSEQFVQHPAFPGEVLYKTGDLAYWLEDGNLKICSRKDAQIKIRGHRIESKEIEHAILETGIANSVDLCKVSSSTGSDRLIAYIKPSETDLGAARDKVALSSWTEMYDQLYSRENQSDLASFATSTWVSAYDHEKIPEAQMKEWQQAIIERIYQQSPGRILEVGCGTGLILLGLKNKYTSYFGVDISSAAINLLSKKIAKFDVRNATLACAPAHELGTLAELHDATFDTIILNSVVQYFPCLEYLEDVLTWCISKLTDSGVIIIGDVRDYRLAPAYYDSIFLANNINALHDFEGRRNYQYARQVQEKELLIDPEYFVDLGTRINPCIRVDVLAKKGHTSNELNTWRYDIVMSFGLLQQADQKKEPIKFHQYEPNTDMAVYFDLKDESFCIRSVPNSRLWSSYWTTAYLEGRVAENHNQHVPIDLETIYELAQQRGYILIPYMAMGFKDAETYLDLLLVKKGHTTQFSSLSGYHEAKNPVARKLSTRPMFAYQYQHQDIHALKAALAEKLPDYMIPQQFIFVPEIPITRNGKVDKARLISLGVSAEHARDVNHVPPRNEIEQQLVQIWQEVLRVDTIGVLDDFFSLGGDSILCIQFISKCRAAGLLIQLIDFIEKPTIAGIASQIKTSTLLKRKEIRPEGDVPLTPIQHWFFARNLVRPEYYNQAFFVSVHGVVEQMALKHIFKKLVDQHDSLRLRFKQDGSGTWLQHYDFSDLAHLFQLENLSHLDDKEFRETFGRCQSQFNLEQGPLLAVAFRCHNEQTDILIALHHLVVDGVSWRILLEDLETGINAYQQGIAPELGDKTDSYQLWAKALEHSAQSPWFTNEYRYWKSIADRCQEKRLISLTAQATTYTDIAQLAFKLSPEDTHTLMKILPEASGLRIHEILFAVYVLSLKKWRDGEAILLHMEGHGREACIEGLDVSRTVGWFTSMFPVLIDLSVDEEQDANLLRIYQVIVQQLRELPNNGMGYGLLRKLRQGPLPKWVTLLGDTKLKFNYLGQFQETQKSQTLQSTIKWSEGTIAPENQPDYLLFLQALIHNGQLHTEFRYNSIAFKLEEMNQLMSIFQQDLHSIINYLNTRNVYYKNEFDIDINDQFDTHEF
ncbi:non-ribosomal peptide synthetase [Legionella bononiensis]|uniref:Amino acid adenylation domain-containing protein n=1 Tax=Legionella bononiensis TaxID=2793102 RepID=A0ABS1WFV2_9GAMM|nr:non-ribosomal peptide synthetase [Legionella bononiensis]MBL7481680.1 amino acid adenylation domain-containing protein [Legionella bononiensis]MBL7528228.1 amino acid adenylation domain-containing protein [Legionella bononiensis]MBL7562703.1 amino acid adenylation domain-containing protein [Legionella bononiensis]